MKKATKTSTNRQTTEEKPMAKEASEDTSSPPLTVSAMRAAKCARCKEKVLAALSEDGCAIAVEALFSQVRGTQFGWDVVSLD